LLFTDIKEKQSELRYPSGYRHDDSLNPLRRKIDDASLYIMDDQALAMAANVALTKPTSILASLPFVALPDDMIWIEYANFQARKAAADMGSPNLRAENAVVLVQRTGFLLYIDADERTGKKDLVMEYVHKDRPFEGRFPDGRESLTDIAPVIGRFSLRDTDDYKLPFFPSIPRDPTVPVAGKMKQLHQLLEKDPTEAAAWHELRARLSCEPHPDLAPLRRTVVAMMGESRVEQLEEDQAGDLERAFLNQILPGLILLNCRNAVVRETTRAPERLNKQRAKKGRPAIREYTTVKVHLSGSAQRAMASTGRTIASSRDGAFVIGHFKVRKTGIFFWGFHLRGGGPTPSGPRRIKVLTA
jgi:hypothetical protein